MGINKKYIEYSFLNLILVADALLLKLFSFNIGMFCIYLICNCIFMGMYTLKRSSKFGIELTIFTMLTYVFFIEIMIHYFKWNVYIEAIYLALVPLTILFIKSIKKNNLELVFFLSIIIINFIVSCVNSVSILFFIKSSVPYIVFIMIGNIQKSNKYNFKCIYKYIFIICILITTFQTVVGFNRDTRNALFGVFGLNAYSFFILCYPVYTISMWLNHKSNTKNVIISIILSLYIYICIENKMMIVLMFAILAVIPLLSKKVNIKRLAIPIICIIMIPEVYKIFLHFYPKFQYLITFDKVFEYFFGNNNWLYKYGRFESLSIIYDNISNFTKFIGKGIGSSTPIDVVFMQELGRKYYVPYYITVYGANHGYQLSSISTTILDGGYFLLTIVVIILLKKFVTAIKHLKKHDYKNNVLGSIQYAGVIAVTLYYVYSNIFVSFKTMFIVALILSLKTENLFEEEEKNEQS